MSRTFLGYASEGSVQSVNSGQPLSVVTISAWIRIADYQSGGIIVVKDPANEYLCVLELDSDGTLFATAGKNYLGTVNNWSIVAPGSGYAHNDTGVANSPNPNIAANLASYQIGGAPGGIPTDPVSHPSGGTGYAVGQVVTTTKGGSQPGSGSGLTLQVTAIINQTNASSQTNEIVALNTWTHVAMTWNGNGDGLIRIYINGIECTYQGQRTVSINANTTTGPWVIGDDLGGFTFEGDIAEVAISETTALTQAQILSIANSTNGIPSGLLSSFTDYWHLCGFTNPEPNVLTPANSGTVTNAAAGPNSPGYTGCVVAVATTTVVGIGEFGGQTLAAAFFNPHQYDLIQILNEGGKVVWNLTYNGVASANPVSFTKQALMNYYGASFAIAFPSPQHQDVFQIISQGNKVVFWVDYTGAAHSA